MENLEKSYDQRMAEIFESKEYREGIKKENPSLLREFLKNEGEENLPTGDDSLPLYGKNFKPYSEPVVATGDTSEATPAPLDEEALKALNTRLEELAKKTTVAELAPDESGAITKIEDFDSLSEETLMKIKSKFELAHGFRWLSQSSSISTFRGLHDMFGRPTGDSDLFTMLMQESCITTKGGLAFGVTTAKGNVSQAELEMMKTLTSLDMLPPNALIEFMQGYLDMAEFAMLAEIAVDQYSGAKSIKNVREFCDMLDEPDTYKSVFLTILTKGDQIDNGKRLYDLSGFMSKVIATVKARTDKLVK